jgi:hypothetical protein
MAKLKPNSQPLRNPGQSIDEEIKRVIHDEFLTYIVLALILWSVRSVFRDSGSSCEPGIRLHTGVVSHGAARLRSRPSRCR